MRRIRVSAMAEQDLDDIWLYIARDSGSMETADRFVQRIVETFTLFSRTPEAGKLRNDIGPEVRSFPVGKYVIYYRIHARNVVISRVIHGMRDQHAAYQTESDPT